MDDKVVAIAFPEGIKLEHAVLCVNETGTEHLLLQFLPDQPREGCLTAIFRGSRAGDADVVKEKIRDWLHGWKGLQQHVDSTAAFSVPRHMTVQSTPTSI